jgi:hypothetical protein
MGVGHSFQWAVSHPEMLATLLAICGSARTSRHNSVFLEGVKAALTADEAWRGGWYERQPTLGLRAAARVYAGWGFSQAFSGTRCTASWATAASRTSSSGSGRGSSSTATTQRPDVHAQDLPSSRLAPTDPRAARRSLCHVGTDPGARSNNPARPRLPRPTRSSGSKHQSDPTSPGGTQPHFHPPARRR